VSAARFLNALAQTAGSTRVITAQSALEAMTHNTLGLQRTVLAAVYPRTVAEVQGVVKAAIACGTPLYAFSRGFNWGYGSRLPAADGCVLVDLQSMSAIVNAREIAAGDPVALLEPGVTQGQLADFLREHAQGFTFNVTGSAPQTSIIGNALERGFGYLGPRSEDLFGLQVVLGTGEIVHTDFAGWTRSPLASTQNVSHGPSLTGLFLQSSFGIVTQGHLRLRRRAELEGALIIRAAGEASIGPLVERLAGLREAHVLHGVPHIANGTRAAASLTLGCYEYFRAAGHRDPLQAARAALSAASFPPWSGVCALSGPRRLVRATVKEVAQTLRGLAGVRFVTAGDLRRALAMARLAGRFTTWGARQAAILSALQPLHGLACGQPTDVPVRNLALMAGRPDLPAVELDRSDVGLIFSSPVLPPTRGAVEKVLRIVDEEFRRFRLTPYITLNIEKPRTAVAVVNSVFRKSDPAETERAQTCAHMLHRRLQHEGYALYRAGVDTMAELVGHNASPWVTVGRIKEVLDPHHIISPGRYAPEAASTQKKAEGRALGSRR
jgi:4-cresol dehydrogenase (hydroxylating)